MFNIEISDTVQFKVKGQLNTADGTSKPFDFDLKCKRLDTDAFKVALDDGDTTLTSFMTGVAIGWSGVRNGAGEEVAFSEEAFRTICRLPGLASLMFRIYGIEVGAKEKN